MPRESGAFLFSAPRKRCMQRGVMDENEDQRNQSQRAFFGRRKGHPLKPRQAALFDTLLPRLALDLSAPVPNDLRRLFPNTPDTVRLEIGFGGAEHLIAQATDNPDCGFIGSDAFINGVAKALVAIDDNTLTNVRLHFGDASELLDWLPANALARIDLLYPDPWPKRRHWKRRFVSEAGLKRLARVLADGAELRLATDDPSYLVWMLQHIVASPDFAWTPRGARDWLERPDDWPETRYEAKAVREGRRPSYLSLRRRARDG